MRKPKIAGDSTYGYVDLSSVNSVNTINKEVELSLLPEQKVELFNSPEVVRNIINLGREIEYQINSSTETEPEKIYGALKILIDKLYKIEKILSHITFTSF